MSGIVSARPAITPDLDVKPPGRFRRWAWVVAVAMLTAVVVATVVDIIARHGAPGRFGELYMAPVRMLVDVFGGGA